MLRYDYFGAGVIDDDRFLIPLRHPVKHVFQADRADVPYGDHADRQAVISWLHVHHPRVRESHFKYWSGEDWWGNDWYVLIQHDELAFEFRIRWG